MGDFLGSAYLELKAERDALASQVAELQAEAAARAAYEAERTMTIDRDAKVQALTAQVERLKKENFQLRHTDYTNHHNALLCPYCNPDRLTLVQLGAVAQLEQEKAEALAELDNWQVVRDEAEARAEAAEARIVSLEGALRKLAYGCG